jgi:CheY-like chemotaxis protein
MNRAFRHHVLLVYDNALALEVMTRMLTLLGCEVTAAASAAVGLKGIDRGEYALMVTDLQMPGMDGWELSRRVKCQRPGMPVLAVTGQDRESVLARMEGSQIDGVLFKPFDLQALGHKVRSLLEAPAPDKKNRFRQPVGTDPCDRPGGATEHIRGRRNTPCSR